jgi:hypothetical protein
MYRLAPAELNGPRQSKSTTVKNEIQIGTHPKI